MGFIQIVNSELNAALNIFKHHGRVLFLGEQPPEWSLGQPTVMLLHGYLVGSASMLGMANYLSSQGFNTDCEGYAFWDDLNKVELAVARNLDNICQRIGEKAKIVGHSEGGLVGYALASKYPEYVERVITLGTPFGGTKVAWLNFFVPSAGQMLPGSSYLRELLRREVKVSIISIYSKYDEVVIPAHHAELDGKLEFYHRHWDEEKGWVRMLPDEQVHNVCVEHVGHGGLITRECYPLIREWLKKELGPEEEKVLDS